MKWQMKCTAEKCKVMHKRKKTYKITYKMMTSKLSATSQNKNLVIMRLALQILQSYAE